MGVFGGRAVCFGSVFSKANSEKPRINLLIYGKEIYLYDISESLILFSHTDTNISKVMIIKSEIYEPKILLFSPFIPLFVCNGETTENEAPENTQRLFSEYNHLLLGV